MPITPAIIEAANLFRARLLARERRAAGAMVQHYRAGWQRLQTDITALSAEVDAMRLAGEEVTRGRLVRLQRMRAIQAQVETELQGFATFSGEAITGQKLESIFSGERESAQLIGLAFPPGAGVSVAFYQMPRGAVRNLAGFLQDGSPLLDVIEGYVGSAATDFGETMVTGLIAGTGPRQMARELRNAYGMGLTDALRLSRTENLRAYRTAARQTYEANSDIVKGWQRHAAKDDRTCLACVLLDGKLYDVATDMDDHVMGRCHPGYVLASGASPVAASARHYTGKLVTIRTATGIELSFTPNHPILTPGGWIAGGLLDEGNYVICGTFGKNAAPAIDEDDDYVPPSIEEIAVSLAVVSAEMPSSAVNFHGDGEGSDVYVVRTNGLLGDDGKPSIFEPSAKDTLGVRGIGLPNLSRCCYFASVRERVAAPTGSLLGDGDAPVMLFDWSALSEEPICFCQASELDSRLEQSRPYCTSRNSILFGNGVFGLTGQIERGDFVNGQDEAGRSCDGCLFATDPVTIRTITEEPAGDEFIPETPPAHMESAADILCAFTDDIGIDCILEVNVRAFSGHVYSLQTKEGWYIASDSIPHNAAAHRGIVTHNCSMLPVTKTYAELGIDAPEPQFQDESAREWFERQPEATQRQMMGAGKFDAWKDGKFALDDLPQLTHSDVWGDSWTPKPLYELLGESGPVGSYAEWVAGTELGDDWLGAIRNNPGGVLDEPDTTDARMREWLKSDLPTDVSPSDQAGFAKNEIVTRLAEQTGIPYEDANRFVAQWAETSNDNDMRSLAIQEDAAKMLGMDLPQWQQDKLNEILKLRQAQIERSISYVEPGASTEAIEKWVQDTHPKYYPLMDSDKQQQLLRAMYDDTQARLDAAGIGDTIRLRRGFTIPDDEFNEWRDRAPRRNPILQTVDYNGSMLESWSVETSTAHNFAVDRNYGETGVVFEMDIPRERIIGSARSGFGCFSEEEFVHFGAFGDEQAIIIEVIGR